MQLKLHNLCFNIERLGLILNPPTYIIYKKKLRFLINFDKLSIGVLIVNSSANWIKENVAELNT